VDTLLTREEAPGLTGAISAAWVTRKVASATVLVGGQSILATVSGSKWSAVVSGPLPNGVYDVQGTVKDKAGKTASDVTTNELTVDSGKPIVSVTPLTTNNTRPTLTGSVSDPSPGSGIAGVKVKVGGHTLTAAVSGGIWSVAVPAVLLDGVYDVEVLAIDGAGNGVQGVLKNGLVVDTVKPTVTAARVVTRENTPTLTGTVSGSTWSVAVPTALADAVYDVAATAADAAGNSHDYTTASALIIDTAPPPLEDPGLEAAILDALGLPAGHRVSRTDLLGLTSFSSDSNQVTSLAGIEYATDLESFSLLPSDWSSPGRLDDLSPLADLPHLRSLALVGLGITDSQLSELGSFSAVGAFGPITSLTLRLELEELDLRYNLISDASILAGLSYLNSLKLHGNPLTNLAPLAGRLIDIDIPPDRPDQAQTIAALADSLLNLPIEIFEYVVNNFSFEPYAGAKKGAQATLETRAGNDWDLDALLVGLLNEAGATRNAPHISRPESFLSRATPKCSARAEKTPRCRSRAGKNWILRIESIPGWTAKSRSSFRMGRRRQFTNLTTRRLTCSRARTVRKRESGVSRKGRLCRGSWKWALGLSDRTSQSRLRPPLAVFAAKAACRYCPAPGYRCGICPGPPRCKETRPPGQRRSDRNRHSPERRPGDLARHLRGRSPR
jgi:hypothetical protein